MEDWLLCSTFPHHRHLPSALFSVRDNGEGISHENKDKIVDVLYSASTTSDGTGLGLYIAKEALVKLKGSINLTS